jgi:hypothetical protein
MITAAILQKPVVDVKHIIKGALILSTPDEVCLNYPKVKDFFYIIERRGWRGLNYSKTADIKLVEDLTFLNKTYELFPNAISLPIGPADFVDTDTFKPLAKEKKYHGIQISCWHAYKRHNLFIELANICPHYNFVKFGHFPQGGTEEEIVLKNNVLNKASENIHFPFASLTSNKDLPSKPMIINNYINNSKIGILTTKVEGINRFKMECLSADIPVLVSHDTSEPTKKHITPETGGFFNPDAEDIRDVMEKVLKAYDNYHPRSYILKHTGKKKSLELLKTALWDLAIRDGTPFIYDNIDWDGRNQSQEWGSKVYSLLDDCITKINNDYP